MLVLLLACTTPTPTPTPTTPPAPPPVPVVEAPPAAPEPPDLRVPTDANVLVGRLADAERRIRDSATDDATAAALGHVQQRIYRALADDPVLAGAVLGKLPDALR